MLFHVLLLTPIGPSAGRYYFQGQGPGRWTGAGIGALGVTGVVEQRQLTALLRGCDPRDGRFLPAWKPARRRSGWDFTLAAPKSVSLLAALADGVSELVTRAQRTAVDEVLADFERRLLRLRRSDAPQGRVASEGAVAAAFEHSVNASGEPHVHTHLLVMNLGRGLDGVWSAIDGRWWPARQSIAALYQLGLRHQLGELGLALDWRTRPDGLGDLADVPRAAVRSASSRSWSVAAAERVAAEAGGGRRSGLRANATVRSRQTASRQPWEERAERNGFGPTQATRVARAARVAAAGRRYADPAVGPNGGPLVRAVTSHLAARRSSFRQSDVLVALSSCAPEGMHPGAAVEWVERFCAGAVPEAVGATSAPRWTTPLALAADQRFVHEASAWSSRARHSVDPAVTTQALAQHRTLSPEGAAAVRRLLESGERVHVLRAPPGRTNLLAHAAVLEAAGAGWRAMGRQVRVAGFEPGDRMRWHTLTGLESHRRDIPADVVVVDRADRRSTPDLLTLLSDIDRSGAAAVLVEGGTSPRLSWTRSNGLEALGSRLGRVDPGAAPSWEPTAEVMRRGAEPWRVGVHSYLTAAGAARDLVARWADAWTPREPAVLVGLGYAETDALNQAARCVRVRRGEISGPALSCGGRVLQAGDRVLPLRRISGEFSRAEALTVVDVDPARSLVSVTAGRRTTTLRREEATHLGYGYAVTPGLLTEGMGRVLLLGPPDTLGPLRDRVFVSASVVPHPAPQDLSRALRPGFQRDAGRTAGLGLEFA
jgi:conjugative relaxase-like TrwC/TraI family protein